MTMPIFQLSPNERHLIKGRNDFKYFTYNVFSQAIAVLKDGRFIGGEHPGRIAAFLQGNKRTCRVSARDHFKSFSFYDHFCWQMIRHVSRNLEGHYFSFNNKMAAYHTEKIKRAIASNPCFDSLIDCKKSAESILKYTWDGEHFITLEPHGLLEFNRGIHAKLIYVDDPFQDPANKLNLTLVKKINEIVLTQVLDMAQDEIHIAGTPQTDQDFFFNDEAMHNFARLIQPAITDEARKEVLWPEWKDWAELQEILKNKGRRRFNQEYLCRPAYSEDSYIEPDDYDKCVNTALINYDYRSWEKELKRREKAGEDAKTDRIAGFDIGKKRHPSLLVVFEHIKNKWIQRHIKFMDHWEYKDQLAYLERAIEWFGIDFLYYDNTRGEFEGFAEANRLPGEMIPVNFTFKRKNAMAVAMDKNITNQTIEFIADDRQRAQMLVVDSDLNAVETPEGHGEAFFSNGLIFAEVNEEDEEDEPPPEPKRKHKDDEWLDEDD